MTEIEKLGRFIQRVDNLGYDADKAIRRLSEEDDVERRISEKRLKLEKLENDGKQASVRLSQIRSASQSATITLQSQEKVIAEADLRFKAIAEKSEKANARIEFAEAVCLLFGDPSRIHPLQLLEIAEMLKTIVKAELNPNTNYPIDYVSARKKAVDLLELALGKELVPRELFDDVQGHAVEKFDDLMLDKLASMEKERKETAKAKAELIAMQQTVEQTALQKTLVVAANLEAQGVIGVTYSRRRTGRSHLQHSPLPLLRPTETTKSTNLAFP